MYKKILTYIILLLLLYTNITSISFGKNSEIKDQNKHLDDLAFICKEPNGFNNIKYEYYKQQLIKQSSPEEMNNNVFAIIAENTIYPIKSKSSLSFSQVSGGPMDSAWPMQSHDVHHTGLSPYSTMNNPGIEKWRFYFSDWLEDTPVIASDGTIYCKGAYNILDHLYAINPNGTEKWKYKTGGLIWGSSPAIGEDGTIYIGAWDYYLYAINHDGTLKWKFNANYADISSSPAIADDGTIYFGTLWSLGDGGKIHAVNPNGTEKWQYQTGWHISSAPAIGEDGTVYIGSGDSLLYALWPNGTLRWRFDTDGEIHGHPTIGDDNTIYIGSWDNYFYAINPDGSLKWKYNLGWGTSNSAAIDADGIIYVGTNKLHALFPNGTQKWCFELGPERNGGSSSPAISADGTIYIGTRVDDEGGEIIAINSDGTERWRKWIADKWVYSSPSIAEDGSIYIGSSVEMSRGYLHAFGSIESNSPPDEPSISGPSRVEVGDDYLYFFKSVDPDNNPIQLYVDWGDGNSGWVGEYASDELIGVEYAWNTQGTYQVKAKVKDVMGEESGWGYLEVKVPLNLQMSQSSNNQQINQQSSNPLFPQLLKRLLINLK